MVSMTPGQARGERLPRILLWSVLSLVLIGVVGFGVWSLLSNNPLQESSGGHFSGRLPVYGVVPDFVLTDQLGRPVRRVDLDGKVWIASFIFTNCPDECPLMTAEMAQLQIDLADRTDLRFVSISVDPERDTPMVLSQYAQQFNADPGRWFFLTGDKSAVYRLAREGFRLGIADPGQPSHTSWVEGGATPEVRDVVNPGLPSHTGQPTSWSHSSRSWLRSLPSVAFADHGQAKETFHSTRFVLIDRAAQIRGYYESREQTALERLRQHVEILFQHG